MPPSFNRLPMSNLALFAQLIGQPFGQLPAPPFSKWLNGTLRAVSADSLEMEFTVRPEMVNPAGLLHGGVHAAILDDLAGMTVAALGLANLYVTMNLAVDYLAPARQGETVRARTQVTRAGKTVVNVVAELYNQSGTLLSRATTNLVNTGLPALQMGQGA